MGTPEPDRSAPRPGLVLLVVLALAGAACAEHPAAIKQRGASVSLKAKWEGTSVLLEAAEFLADEDASKFWDFVEAVDAGSASSVNGTCWARILELAGRGLSPQLQKVLESFVALRYHSPRLEMMRSLAAPPAEDSCCWVSIGNEVLVEAGLLKEKAAASGTGEQLHSFDHIYGGGHSAANEDSAAPPGAVLYGAPGTPCFSAMHAELAALANAGAVRYALRPYLARGCAANAASSGLAECLELGTGEALPLPGYGVELAIKNMEYKAMDDSELKAKGQEDKDADEGDEGLVDEEVSGFLFGRLLERKPESRTDLLAFRDHLIAQKSSAEDEALKVWQVKDLGLQAVQRVSHSKDPLRLLADISQNFPSRATSLSRLEVDSALRAEVKRIQQSLPSETNFLLLNGLMVDVKTLELYSLAERVRHDTRVSQRLEAAGIPNKAIPTLLALRPSLASEGEDDIRIDLGSKVPVRFLNNLEKDRMYQGWQPSLQALLMPSFGGQMMPVARNVFTAIHIVDPDSKQGLKTVKGLLTFWMRGMPMRVGAVLAPRSAVARIRAERLGLGAARSPDSGEMDVAERIARMFHMLFKNLSPKTAFEFLAELGGEADSDSDPYSYDYEEEEEEEDEYDDADGDDSFELTAVGVNDAFAKAWAAGGKSATTKKGKLAAKLGPEEALQQLEEGAGYAQGIADLVLDDARFVLDRGLVPPPAEDGGALLWFNGIVRSERISTALMMEFQYEVQRVQMQVYQGKLTDGSNVATQILKNAGAVPRYNPVILGSDSPLEKEGDAGSDSSGARNVDLPVGKSDVLQTLKYFTSPGTFNNTKAVTHWVVTDLDTDEGRDLAYEALKYTGTKAASTSKARVGLLHCPGMVGPVPKGSMSPLARVTLAASFAAQAATDGGNSTTAFLADLLGPAGLDVRKAMSNTGGAKFEAAFEAPAALADAAGADSKAILAELLSGGATQAHADAYAEAVCGLIGDDGLGLTPGSGLAVITNGRLVPNAGTAISSEDFQLMAVYSEKNQAVKEVAEALKESSKSLTPSRRSDNIMMASGMLRRLGLRDDMKTDEASLRLAEVVGQLKSKAGALLSWDPPSGSPALDVTAVVDPLTPGAQKLVSLLLFLRSSFNPRMRVWLNPKLELSELPLKSFFRFALPGLPGDDAALRDDPGAALGNQGMPGPPEAVFGIGLPQKKILTLNVHPPEAWLVEPVLAPYDTDNLLLEDLPEGETMVTADFELEALMITGSCIDMSAKTREAMQPRGVQLHLGDSYNPHVVDTLVMSNLGYFQLKGAPGVWSLSLAPGATSALYTIHSSSGFSEEGSMQTSDAAAATHVVVSSMSGKHMYLKLTKKAGHADDDVLTYKLTPEEAEEQAALVKVTELPGESAQDASIPDREPGNKTPAESTGSGSLWGRLASMLGSGDSSYKPATTRQSSGDEDATVNIFTVASGHMYERLQKIMILSVLNHTSAPVKFWFIKNYMSPQMKAFLPYFAEEYGFEYELVTYKWPRWLHKQTEKQRIIWAYKILFLDVLFPLNLKKVVFVDADQIIRADMKELIDMDLRGAPYAYTPFCDNNKEMDGYRFWKQGFWKDHLRGRPYHISALYVVDLERFRQTAAGDQLRILYDSLSKDPNSLANLDQDLPNYAQHQVKIHSLPQEWLWCESWCGNSTKPRAKTIDLCNNPMTKEPKLQGARRIVKEWPSYDEEVSAFTARIEAILEGNEITRQDIQADGCEAGDGACNAEGIYASHDEAAAVLETVSDAGDRQHDASEL